MTQTSREEFINIVKNYCPDDMPKTKEAILKACEGELLESRLKLSNESWDCGIEVEEMLKPGINKEGTGFDFTTYDRKLITFKVTGYNVSGLAQLHTHQSNSVSVSEYAGMTNNESINLNTESQRAVNFWIQAKTVLENPYYSSEFMDSKGMEFTEQKISELNEYKFVSDYIFKSLIFSFNLINNFNSSREDSTRFLSPFKRCSLYMTSSEQKWYNFCNLRNEKSQKSIRSVSLKINRKYYNNNFEFYNIMNYFKSALNLNLSPITKNISKYYLDIVNIHNLYQDGNKFGYVYISPYLGNDNYSISFKFNELQKRFLIYPNKNFNFSEQFIIDIILSLKISRIISSISFQDRSEIKQENLTSSIIKSFEMFSNGHLSGFEHLRFYKPSNKFSFNESNLRYLDRKNPNEYIFTLRDVIEKIEIQET